MSTIQWGGGSAFIQASLGTWSLDSGLGTFFSSMGFSWTFLFFPPHTVLFFMCNHFPNQDALSWKRERKKLVKIWAAFCYVCFFCFCCYAHGLGLVIQPQNSKVSFTSVCLSLHWLLPRFTAGFLCINLEVFDVFTPSFKELIAAWKSKGFTSTVIYHDYPGFWYDLVGGICLRKKKT